MESLVANYASSDEDEDQQTQHHPPPSSSSSLFSSLPQPKSSSVFSSLPPPKQKSANISVASSNGKVDEVGRGDEDDVGIPRHSVSHPKNPSNIFSSLPQPKSKTPQQSQQPNPPTVKRVVQFKPPVNPISFDDEDDDEEEEEEKRQRRKESEKLPQGPSIQSFFSSLPAARNSATLGLAPSSGSGRRSIIETQAPTSTFEDKSEASVDKNARDYSNFESGIDQSSLNCSNYGDYQSSVDQNSVNYGNYGLGSDQNIGNYENYANYTSYQLSSDPNVGQVDVSYGSYQYENNGVGGSVGNTMPETTVMAEIGKVKGKRGRNELPTEIVEVNQDELMKNRPRQDQVKMTGIAFGPSYQPASSKGKPSKLHKRKHQIGSLYHEMKQKEMELQERRSRGLLTKAETQAKYGW